MKKNDLNEKGGMRIADIPTYHKHAKLNQENQFLAYFKQKKKTQLPYVIMMKHRGKSNLDDIVLWLLSWHTLHMGV